MAQQTYNSAIDEIKSRCNIVDVVSSLVTLRRTGSNYKGICPFHNEKTPSFVVSEPKQIFTCFGCGASGDVIEFVKKYYNLTFPEAVERLALQYGIEITSSYSDQGKKKEGYYEVNRQAARYFYDAFTQKANPGLEYMKKRGIEPKILQTFGIGYADEDWNSLSSHLLKNGAQKDILTELGLVSEKNGKIYDKFRNRVMFPIINTRGKVIGFGGRVLGSGEPKYLNSQESVVFQKKYNLFGLNVAKGDIQKEGLAILVEGYMDVIGLYQHGIKNAVASLGTALTEQQAKLLKRYTEKVVLCYDADAAGVNAALRGIDILRAAGLSVKVLHVNDGKDPDEYIRKHGREEFIELLNKNSLPDTDYKITLLKMKYKPADTEQSVKFLQKAAEILSQLTPVETDLYIQKIAKENNISEGALRREVYKDENKLTAKVVPYSERQPDSGKAPADEGASFLERMLLRLVLLKSDYLPGIQDYPEAVVSAPGMKLMAVLQEMYQEDVDFDIPAVKEALEEQELTFLQDILREVQLGEKDEEAFEDCIAKLQERRLEKRKNEIINVLSLAEEGMSQERLDDLMKEFMSIQQMQKR
jgi:DNA primase